jgi:hypothetical protein
MTSRRTRAGAKWRPRRQYPHPPHIRLFSTSSQLIMHADRGGVVLRLLRLVFCWCSVWISARASVAPTAGFLVFPQSRQRGVGVVSWLHGYHFHPNPFKFIIYVSCHWTLCGIGTKGVVTYPSHKTNSNTKFPVSEEAWQWFFNS